MHAAPLPRRAAQHGADRLLQRGWECSGSGDRCVFANVRSTILSAHYGDDVRQRAFGDLARRLHEAARMPAGLIEEGDGQKNRRPGAFSFRFLTRPIEKRAECAQECAQTGVPKTKTRRRYNARLWLHLAPKATV
jgi:hypothetical protein